MGCVQQAVLEFDEEVQAPWRPRLVPVPDVPDMAGAALFDPLRARPSRRSPSRVGACRPPAARPRQARPGRRPTSGPAAAARSERVRPGRPVGAVRLTRRARRLAVVLALTAGVALGSWLAPLLSGSGGGDLRLAGESSVVVQAGDTLWSIASSLDDDGDVRAVIDEIQRLNDLDGAVLVPGQVLQLP
jgi:nucleoid-associated protein YgaU